MNEITITLIILTFAVVMLIWEKIPLALTAMIVAMTFVLTGILTPAQGFAGFVNSNVIVFFSMFIVGGALFETGAAAQVGGLVMKLAKTERQTMFLLMLVAGVMSGLLSNTATAAMFLPVIIGISTKSGISRSRLLMPMAFATSMGGSLTLVGTPPNLIVQSVVQEAGYSFGFFEFAIIGVPRLGLGILYFYFFGYKLLPKGENTHVGESIFDDAPNDFSHIPRWKRIGSMIILALTSLGMALESVIGVPLHVTSAIGALSLVLFGIISEKQAYRAVDMSTIFLFAGTLALATALDITGTGAAIANVVIGLLGENAPPIVLLITIVLLAGALTQFMSNTASAAILAPVVLSIAIGMNIDPRAAMMAVATGSTIAYASPVATPPLTMIYGLGGYKFTDYIKNGMPVIVIVFLASIIVLPIFFPF